jgi:hypothetical protein
MFIRQRCEAPERSRLPATRGRRDARVKKTGCFARPEKAGWRNLRTHIWSGGQSRLTKHRFGADGGDETAHAPLLEVPGAHRDEGAGKFKRNSNSFVHAGGHMVIRASYADGDASAIGFNPNEVKKKKKKREVITGIKKEEIIR